MAEIQVERRKKGRGARWLSLFVLIVLPAAGWYFVMGSGSSVIEEADLTPVIPDAMPNAPTTGTQGSLTPPAPRARALIGRGLHPPGTRSVPRGVGRL